MEEKIIGFWKYISEKISNLRIHEVAQDMPKLQNNPENVFDLTQSGIIFMEIQKRLNNISKHLMIEIHAEKVNHSYFGGTEKLRYVLQIYGKPEELVEIIYEARNEVILPNNWIIVKHTTRDVDPDSFVFIPVVRENNVYLLPIKGSYWKFEEQTPERRSLLLFFPDEYLKCKTQEDVYKLRGSVLSWLVQILGEPRASTIVALTVLPISGMEQMNLSYENLHNSDPDLIHFLKNLDPMRNCLACKIEESHVDLEYHDKKLPVGYYCNYCIKQLLD